MSDGGATKDSDLPSSSALPARQLVDQWRCFHCDEVFTDRAEAAEHFGANEWKEPACRLSREDVGQLRALEAANARLKHDCEELENDARLWHEAEADRRRRIGDRQWWQELDYREGEKLALEERLAALLDPAPPETNEEDVSRRDTQAAPVVSSPPQPPTGD